MITHPFRDEVPFLLLEETPPIFGVEWFRYREEKGCEGAKSNVNCFPANALLLQRCLVHSATAAAAAIVFVRMNALMLLQNCLAHSATAAAAAVAAAIAAALRIKLCASSTANQPSCAFRRESVDGRRYPAVAYRIPTI